MTVEDKDKKRFLDIVQGHINATIQHFVKEDVFEAYLPMLSPEAMSHDSDFFKSNHITVALGLNSEEYKTASYLALFYKEKANYSVDNINKYLKFIGYDVSESPFDLLVMDKTKTYTTEEANYITFDEYMALSPIAYMPVEHTMTSKVSTYGQRQELLHIVLNGAYIDGFDISFDEAGMR